MIWIVALLCLATAIFIFIMVVNDDTIDRDFYFFCGMVFCLFVILAIGLLVTDLSHTITPMDVYQGKTTLKYEVVDGVKIDSTVIWKEQK